GQICHCEHFHPEVAAHSDSEQLLGIFFSSRRRHTSWPRDWSSDVCSSDLSRRIPPRTFSSSTSRSRAQATTSSDSRAMPPHSPRSEERRVGKEWRCQWAQFHHKVTAHSDCEQLLVK